MLYPGATFPQIPWKWPLVLNFLFWPLSFIQNFLHKPNLYELYFISLKLSKCWRIMNIHVLSLRNGYMWINKMLNQLANKVKFGLIYLLTYRHGFVQKVICKSSRFIKECSKICQRFAKDLPYQFQISYIHNDTAMVINRFWKYC